MLDFWVACVDRVRKFYQKCALLFLFIAEPMTTLFGSAIIYLEKAEMLSVLSSALRADHHIIIINRHEVDFNQSFEVLVGFLTQRLDKL